MYGPSLISQLSSREGLCTHHASVMSTRPNLEALNDIFEVTMLLLGKLERGTKIWLHALKYSHPQESGPSLISQLPRESGPSLISQLSSREL